MYRIKLPHVEYKAAQHRNLWIGAAVNVSHGAGEFDMKEEVLLLDGTAVFVTSVEHGCTEPFESGTPAYDEPCVQIQAEIDWTATVDYYKIFT
jgi:hypothetical protein